MVSPKERKLFNKRLARINKRLDKRFPNCKGFLGNDKAHTYETEDGSLTVCIKVVPEGQASFIGWAEVRNGYYLTKHNHPSLDRKLDEACRNFEASHLAYCKGK